MTDDYSEKNGSTTDNGGQERQTKGQAYEEIFAEIEKQRTRQKAGSRTF